MFPLHDPADEASVHTSRFFPAAFRRSFFLHLGLVLCCRASVRPPARALRARPLHPAVVALVPLRLLPAAGADPQLAASPDTLHLPSAARAPPRAPQFVSHAVRERLLGQLRVVPPLSPALRSRLPVAALDLGATCHLRRCLLLTPVFRFVPFRRSACPSLGSCSCSPLPVPSLSSGRVSVYPEPSPRWSSRRFAATRSRPRTTPLPYRRRRVATRHKVRSLPTLSSSRSVAPMRRQCLPFPRFACQRIRRRMLRSSTASVCRLHHRLRLLLVRHHRAIASPRGIHHLSPCECDTSHRHAFPRDCKTMSRLPFLPVPLSSRLSTHVRPRRPNAALRKAASPPVARLCTTPPPRRRAHP